jgi:hypothetical protein
MHTPGSSPSRLLPRAALATPLALLLAACPSDDAPADTEATAGSSSGGASTTTGPGPDPDTTAASESSSSSSSSTTAVVDDTTDDTTGEPPQDGICEGFLQSGNVATVLSRDGMPIDTTCDPVPAPCGGDPVGSWTLEDTCGFEGLPNPLADACPGSTFMVEVLSTSGTLTFVDDGTFVQDFDIQSQVVVTLDPMACFMVDCATFEMLVQGDNPTATCMAMGPTCECTIPDDGMPEQAMGTWEVMDNDLVLTTAEGGEGFQLCITGDRLDLWQPLFAITPTEVLCMDEQDCIDALGDMYDFYSCSPPEG